MKRVIMHLVYQRPEARWHLMVHDASLASFDCRREALEAGHARGRHLFESEACFSQLIVHRMDGTIETEYELGHDPARLEESWGRLTRL